MLGDLNRKAGAEGARRVREFNRARTFLTEESIQKRDEAFTSEEIRLTNFVYGIVCKPSWKNPKKKPPFTICCDLYPNSSKRFPSYEEMKRDAETDVVSAFLIKWGQITEETFERAKRYPGIHFPIAFEWEKYFAHVEAQAGVDAKYIFTSKAIEEAVNDNLKKVNERREKSAHHSNEIRRQKNAAKRLAKEQGTWADGVSEV